MKKIQFLWRHMPVDSEGENLSIYCLIIIYDNLPFSWIFTNYANEWPPRKKIRKGSTRKKINTKKKPEVVNTKKEPEVSRDLWPLTRDPWPLTSPTKRSPLTTHD